MAKVLFATAETAPFYKTGGLGDVSGALPRALAALGTDIRVVVPYYEQLFPATFRDQLVDLSHFDVQVGAKTAYCGVKTLTVAGVQYYLIDNRDYFDRPNLYGYWDDGERFAFFQLAICEMMTRVNFVPDVLHLNDWHTAFIPVLLAEKYYWISEYTHLKTVLTIHNLQFQGIYDPIILDSLFGIGVETFTEDGIAFYDQVNFLKGGLNFADVITTVSPTYAQEIQTPSFGERLDGVLRANRAKLHGILNGIDTQQYDPLTDPALAANYAVADLRPKEINKQAVQRAFGLPATAVPVLAVVSRLTKQKGIDLLLDALDPFLRTHDVQVLVLGTGDPDLEHAFQIYQLAYPTKLGLALKFDVQLAQQLYAGSDLFLMPSAFEPCGLSQMMAMHYGTLPIVHAVGGLRDTVTPYNRYTGRGTGFSFDDYRPAVLGQTLERAVTLYTQQPRIWAHLQRQAMTVNFGWKKSARRYAAIYQSLMS